MAQTIKLKRSAVAGRVPSTSDLDLGEIGINTVDGKAYIKKSVSGVESVVQLGSAAAAADAIMVEYQFTATNNQTSFSGGDDNSVQLGYTSGAVQVFLNGVLLDNGIDYTANNSVSVVLAEAATTGDFLQVIAFKKKIGEGNVSVATLSGNGTATAYTLPLDPDNENNTRVFIDGVYQSKSNYSVSGTTLTFSTAPPNGTAIEVEISGRSITLDTAATIDLPDNTKLTAGDAGDLEIFHDASNSYIKDVGTGNLKISTNNQVDITKGTSETMATFVADGAATLYHDNAAKIATSATGVTITGAAAATTFSGDLSGTINTATTAATQSAGNNSTKVATTAYVDVAIAALGDSAPGTLNTLNELAAALGDDANFAATTATALGLRVSKTADTGAAVIPVGTTAQRPTAAAGQFRYNSTLGKFEGYTDAWGEIGGGGAASFAADNFTGNGSTTAYALTTPAASEDNLLVFIEGVFQQQNAFSIATSGGTTTLTFSAAPANGNSIIIYRLSPAVNGTNLTSNTMTGDGSDTTLTLSAAPVNENNTQVFVNGVYQNKSTYSISGTTLTFSEAPPTGALVECMTMNQLDINVPVDDSITSAKLSGNLTTPGTLAVTGGITATTTDNSDTLTLISTDADASSGPNLRLYRNSGSPADVDELGNIIFQGRNDNSQDVEYAEIEAYALDASDGTEDGLLNFNTIRNGAVNSFFKSNATEVVINDDSVDLDFRVESDNSTHALFVEGSSSNVGIGVTAPTRSLVLGKGDSTGVQTQYTNSTTGAALGDGFTVGIDGSENAEFWNFENTNMLFATNGTERMRIDNVGNLLVGSTSLAVSSSTGSVTGAVINTTGLFEAAKTGTVMELNRLTADGTILNFRKDGTSVGSVGVDNNDNFYVGASAAGHGGLYFGSQNMSPMAAGVRADATMDVGAASYKFRNAYLSGFVAAGDGSAAAPSIKGTDTNTGLFFPSGGVTAITRNGVEGARMDANGDFCVGRTSQGRTGNGHSIRGGDSAIFSRDSTGETVIIARNNTPGPALRFDSNGSNIGGIGTHTTGGVELYMGNGGNIGFRFEQTGADRIEPCVGLGQSGRNNAIDLGISGNQWRSIYCSTVIESSDRTLKQDIEELSDAEQRVAVVAKSLLRKYRFISDVEQDDNRYSFGIIAQDLQAAFAAEGLDAANYKMWSEATFTDETTGEEKTQQSIVYSQLLAFIISAI
jgi:hypothetical protein